jgi:hypothetical protein
MTTSKKFPENSVTEEMIKKVHLTLSDFKTGEQVLDFLRTTEPLFMDEVNRFIKTEMSRMRFHLTETQTLYIGSVIGATYIAGFLIAREAIHQMFDGLINVKSPVSHALSPEEIDTIIDKNIEDGKTYKQIAKLIKAMLEKGEAIGKTGGKKKSSSQKDTGDRFKLGDLS